MSVRIFSLSAVLAILLMWPASAQTIAPLVLKDGDRVVLLGSALIEHEQFHGYLETRLTRRYPQAAIIFRNLGWSGDTVGGVARTSGLDNPDGFARLLKEVLAFKPTVIFIGYGMNESFDGPQGLPGFLKGFGSLLDHLAPLNARVVVLSPAFHEDLGPPFPDPAQHNQHLEQYTAALEKLAVQRKLWFVDLFHPLTKLKQAAPKRRLTTNGLLPNEHGYELIAGAIEGRLFDAPRTWKVELDRSGKVLRLRSARARAKLGGMKAGPDSLRFEVIPAMLPAPGLLASSSPSPELRVTGLGPGQYVLRINGREVQGASAAQWERGVRLVTDPALAQTEKLLAAVIKKNELFYRRWRPFNDHDRHWGFIGGDFKLYDAQVAEQEMLIAKLRHPAALRCEIVAKEKGK